MERIKVSVILPVWKETDVLCATVESLLEQKCPDFELLCMTSGKASFARLDAWEAKDGRIHGIREPFSTVGEAANRGLELARGEYVLVLQPGDVAAPHLLELVISRAEQWDADIVAFCGHAHSRVAADRKDDVNGYDMERLTDVARTYAPKKFRDNGLSLLSWDVSLRLTRLAFLRERGIRFAALDSQWQLPFCCLSDAQADRVVVTGWRLLTKPGPDVHVDSTNVLASADATLQMLEAFPDLQQAAIRRLVEYTTDAFRCAAADFAAPEAQLLYEGLQERFASPAYARMRRETLNPRERSFFDTILQTPYTVMLERSSVSMVASFTSFPARIGFASRVVENIHRQTHRAHRLLLYLAPEQFPDGENALPQQLLDQMRQGMVELRWRPDIRSHKKYQYAMKEFPDSLVVTLDDDLTYPDNMLEKLFQCYLCHPGKISAMRAHLTVADNAAERILPYNRWVKEYRRMEYVPSAQLFATSGAGTLFPPHVLHPLALDGEKAWSLCPYADDVWLNCMILFSGSSVVLAVRDFSMKVMPGSQEVSLQQVNVDANQNDVQLDAVRNWLKDTYGTDVVWNAISAECGSVRCQTVWELSDQYLALDEDRKQMRGKMNQFWRDKTARENDLKREKEKTASLIEKTDVMNQKLKEQDLQLMSQKKQLEEEMRSFRLLRKIRRGCRLVREKGLGYTVKLAAKKILGKMK